MQNIPLNALRTFEAVASHLSFSKGAEALNVTPAAVSSQIRTLEERLNLKLFHRQGRNITLTTAGRRLLPGVQRGLRELKLPAKVRRQHPIGRHVADFAIPACKLVIEIDGGQHAVAVEADAKRTRSLNGHGYRVIRFWNNDVIGNLEGVLQTITEEMATSPTSP